MMFGAGALMPALVQIGNSGEVATIAALASSGVVALLALAAHQRGAVEPILPLKLWRDRIIAVGSLAVFSLFLAFALLARLSPTRPLTRL